MGGKNSKAKKEPVPDNQKAPARKHTYEEIDDEELAANQREHSQAQAASQNNATPPVTSTANTRLHPYDEVTDEQLTANRKAAGKNSKKSKKGKQPNSKGAVTKLPQETSGVSVASDPDSAEYQNMSSVQLSQCSNSDVDDQHITEGGDLYALPAKKTNPPPKQLNYIEVEFNKSPTTEVKPKANHAPTNYTNVINDNGKVVLLTEP